MQLYQYSHTSLFCWHVPLPLVLIQHTFTSLPIECFSATWSADSLPAIPDRSLLVFTQTSRLATGEAKSYEHWLLYTLLWICLICINKTSYVDTVEVLKWQSTGAPFYSMLYFWPCQSPSPSYNIPVTLNLSHSFYYAYDTPFWPENSHA